MCESAESTSPPVSSLSDWTLLTVFGTVLFHLKASHGHVLKCLCMFIIAHCVYALFKNVMLFNAYVCFCVCRDMIHSINPKYTSPTRGCLTNGYIMAWYEVEKSNVPSELSEVQHIALTCDGWTSLTQDHYLTVTVHHLVERNMRQKVHATKAVYAAQTGIVVAEEICNNLKEFGVFDKVVAVMVDNAASMDVAIKQLQFLKHGCFAHSLNLSAQSLYSSSLMWTAKTRAIIVWMERMAKVVL